MASGYLHGVYSREVPTEILPPRRVDTNVIVAFGTAPVHTLKAGVKRPVNEPVLCYGYSEFVAAFGWSEDWKAYTLCEVADAVFAQYGMAPVVFVNVFDPAVHVTPVTDESKTFAKTTVTCDRVPASGLVVRDSAGEVTYELDVDYAVDTATGVVTRLESGLIEEGDTVKLSYSAAAPEAVAASDVLGGIDADTLKRKGLELVDEVFPRFRLVPGSIIAPGFSDREGVGVTMAAKANGINGLFNAIALIDVPTDTVSKYTDVPGYKEKKNLTDKFMAVCWPLVTLGGKVYHLSSQLAGCISATDDDAGGTPQVSPSNKRAYIDGAVIRTAAGELEEVWLGLDQNNYLNGQGIVTVSNFDGGWKFWGNRTGCYPSNTDPKDAFLPVRRFFNWYANTFILTYFAKIDSPLTRRLINTFIKSEQIRLDGYTAQGVINGGRIVYIEDENPLTDLLDGMLRFHLFITPPVPARVVEGIFEFDPDYLKNLMGDD